MLSELSKIFKKHLGTLYLKYQENGYYLSLCRKDDFQPNQLVGVSLTRFVSGKQSVPNAI